MLHKVFVYGTLKSGQVNHFWLQGYQGKPAIAPHINLHAGPHYPFAVRGEGQAKGELYEVSETTLNRLDSLEGHPDDYRRELTTILPTVGSPTEGWIYLNQEAYQHPRISADNWEGRIPGLVELSSRGLSF